MKDTVAASKYAHALFRQAEASNQILACQQGLEEFVRVARLRPSLKQILGHPFITPEEKRSVIRSALGEYATPLLERFLAQLVRKHRIDLLYLIAQEFQADADRHQNVQPIKVRTAFALTDEQSKQLHARMESWLKTKVRMDVQVDPQLIGGVVVQTRDYVLDKSLKGQLKRLQTHLSS